MKKFLFLGLSLSVLIASDDDQQNQQPTLPQPAPVQPGTSIPIPNLSGDEHRALAARLRENERQRQLRAAQQQQALRTAQRQNDVVAATESSPQTERQQPVDLQKLRRQQEEQRALRDAQQPLQTAIARDESGDGAAQREEQQPDIRELGRLRAERYAEQQRLQQEQQQAAAAPAPQRTGGGRRLDDEAEARHQEELRQQEAARQERDAQLRAEREHAAKVEALARDEAELNDIRIHLDEFFEDGLFSNDGRHLEIIQKAYQFWKDKFNAMPFDIWIEDILRDNQPLTSLLEQFRAMGDNPLQGDFFGYILFNKIFRIEENRGMFDCLVDHTSLQAFIDHMNHRFPQLQDTDKALEFFKEIAILTNNRFLEQVIDNWLAFRRYALGHESLFAGNIADTTSIVKFMTFIETNKETYEEWLRQVRSRERAQDIVAEQERQAQRERHQRQEEEEFQRALRESAVAHQQPPVSDEDDEDLQRVLRESRESADQYNGVALAAPPPPRPAGMHHEAAATAQEEFDPEFVQHVMQQYGGTEEDAKQLIRDGLV